MLEVFGQLPEPGINRIQGLTDYEIYLLILLETLFSVWNMVHRRKENK